MRRTSSLIRMAALIALVNGFALPLRAAEPPKNTDERSDFTHEITTETVYYKNGPQQMRPPDGKLSAGTKVRLLREAGSYSLVQTAGGVTAYVAADALKEAGRSRKVEVTPQVREIAESNNAFAIDLYRQLSAQDGNLFFSPASISTALAMAWAGAEGETQRQMAGVLHLQKAKAPIPEDQLHEAFGTLSASLNSQSKNYQLSMANRLWGQKTYPFHPQYLETTRDSYGAELASIDFRQSEAARQTINDWIAEQTSGRIENLIPPGVLNAMTRLVLTNAIYFKGAWAEDFSKQATKDAAFHLTGGRDVMVPMMHQAEDFRYGESEDVQLLELPYGGYELSMVVVLPKRNDGLPALEKALTAENARAWLSSMRRREVQVYLPRFKMTSQFKLAETLQSLGMMLPFSEQADFSGMSTAEDLMISEVIHKAFVDVNEEGTEAAAATAVVIAPASAPVGEPERPVVFRADHPFVFMIRDNRTGAILFLGRVTDPSE